ncbi:aldehyde dehydrogenase family protein [Alkalihalobacillus clausii]|uniref:aldehyde dehydrogenase family protein n=1 Tax=Shouchella clausii TaxID=79880 RepID=UPI00203E132E|nr:aldehyde dehydrogenase family protein [Shouchella clausii]MCM3550784.1 aldehyde dehydrogenase family protein [Shouchella clausii]
MSEQKKLYINGEWVEGVSYQKLYSPYDHEEIAEIPLASEEQVLSAIASAECAKKTMKSLSAYERSQILNRVADLFEVYKEECAQILASENAKPIKAARGEIVRTIETYRFAADEAKRIHGELVPLGAAQNGKGRFGYTKHEPLGVIAAITPFNFPFNLTAHKLGPAFAAGNTVVLKPASQTPLSGYMTARIFEEAGLPKGALNVITGKGGLIGDLLVKDDRVKMVTFTGSVPVGKSIREKAGLKKVTLELGSNSGVIVDSTDDLEAVVARCVEGAFTFAGQVCISIQRIYVKSSLYERFLESFVNKAKSLKLGNPKDENTDVSALINASETERIEAWLKEAKEQGATIAFGGEKQGTVLGPTIITGASNNLAVNCKEAFGPIVTIEPYEELEEAIEKVNDSEYGLQAGIYTTEIKKAFTAADELEVGGVIINDIPSFRVDNMPYGGVKNSGTGREGVKYSTEEMTELKFISFKL